MKKKQNPKSRPVQTVLKPLNALHTNVDTVVMSLKTITPNQSRNLLIRYQSPVKRKTIASEGSVNRWLNDVDNFKKKVKCVSVLRDEK